MNQVILAPAGGRKTQRIVEMCSNLSTPKKRAVITYTTTAQRVLVDRLLASDAREQMPTVMGWYTFLLDHVVRPYASSIPELKDRRIKGLHLVTESLSKWLSGAQYYLTNAGDVYNERLGLLASKVMKLIVKQSLIDLSIFLMRSILTRYRIFVVMILIYWMSCSCRKLGSSWLGISDSDYYQRREAPQNINSTMV